MIIVVLPILLGACDLNYDSSHRLKCNVYSMDDIIKKNNVFLINAVINNQGEHKRFIIDYDTNFDQSCEKQYLGNYEDGETVMDWYKKNYDLYKVDDPNYNLDLLGVFDVDVTGRHIDTIYGIY